MPRVKAENATATAARIPFTRHAEGEKGAPRRGGFAIKTARPTKERSGRKLPLTAHNVTSEPEAGARYAPGGEFGRSRAAGAART